MSAFSDSSEAPDGCTIRSSKHRCNRAVLIAVLWFSDQRASCTRW
jgi:hypothetical protein